MKLNTLLASAALAISAVAITSPAQAQQAGLYVNGGVTHFSADSVDLGGVTGRVGYNFTPYLGAEAEASLGVIDDDNVELDKAVGLFGVARWPLGERIDLFARAGVSHVDVTGGEDEGFAFGVGGNYWFTPVDGVRADITRHNVDDAGGDVDALSVSYARRF